MTRTILKHLIILSCLFFAACSTPIKKGMKAYADADYETAVNELSRVESSNEDYDLAMAMLAKAEYKMALQAFKNAHDPKVLIEHIKKMIPLAMRTKSKELLEEANKAIADKLKETADMELMKALMKEKLKFGF